MGNNIIGIGRGPDMAIMTTSRKHWLAAALLLAASVLLAGCVSTGYGGYPGSGQGQYPGYGNADLVGSVLGVDRGDNRIVLATRGSARQMAVHYDRRTRLHYRGRVYPVEGLERGDVIRLDVQRVGRRLYARSIEVVRNVRDDRGSYGQANVFRGSVIHVDLRARTIVLDGGYGQGRTRLRYDNRTVVEYRGSRYQPRNLERGDIVRIRAHRQGNQWLAEHVQVERDSSSY